MEQLELEFDIDLSGNDDPNIMVKIFGKAVEGQKCKSCCHLRKITMDKNYYKCTKRGITKGAATDIRLKWNACKLYCEKGDL